LVRSALRAPAGAPVSWSTSAAIPGAPAKPASRGGQPLGAVGQQFAHQLDVVGLLDQLHQRHLVASGVS
jgi:hypothetical protein